MKKYQVILRSNKGLTYVIDFESPNLEAAVKYGAYYCRTINVNSTEKYTFEVKQQKS